jgi:hypothetical protein
MDGQEGIHIRIVSDVSSAFLQCSATPGPPRRHPHTTTHTHRQHPHPEGAPDTQLASTVRRRPRRPSEPPGQRDHPAPSREVSSRTAPPGPKRTRLPAVCSRRYCSAMRCLPPSADHRHSHRVRAGRGRQSGRQPDQCLPHEGGYLDRRALRTSATIDDNEQSSAYLPHRESLARHRRGNPHSDRPTARCRPQISGCSSGARSKPRIR